MDFRSPETGHLVLITSRFTKKSTSEQNTPTLAHSAVIWNQQILQLSTKGTKTILESPVFQNLGTADMIQ